MMAWSWFRDNMMGPLSMALMGLLGAGVFSLVTVSLSNQKEILLKNEVQKQSLMNHNELKEVVIKLVEAQTEDEIRYTILRHDFDELRRGLRNENK